MAEKTWDTLIIGALVFDGKGASPSPLDIALKAGLIVAKGSDLPASQA